MTALEHLASPRIFSSPVSWPAHAGEPPLDHRVYGLLDCPELEACTFVFTRRTTFGDHEVLLAGDLGHAAPSLNLAALRRLGANLGVRLGDIEVHVLREAAVRPAPRRSVSKPRPAARQTGQALRPIFGRSRALAGAGA